MLSTSSKIPVGWLHYACTSTERQQSPTARPPPEQLNGLAISSRLDGSFTLIFRVVRSPTALRNGDPREKENSCHSIWNRAYRRFNSKTHARKRSYRDYRRH